MHLQRDRLQVLLTVFTAALIRQMFTANSGEAAQLRLSEATSQFERRLPKIAAMIEEAEEDILAFYEFPKEHWPKLSSTNPLERFNREISSYTTTWDLTVLTCRQGA